MATTSKARRAKKSGKTGEELQSLEQGFAQFSEAYIHTDRRHGSSVHGIGVIDVALLGLTAVALISVAAAAFTG